MFSANWKVSALSEFSDFPERVSLLKLPVEEDNDNTKVDQSNRADRLGCRGHYDGCAFPGDSCDSAA